ncbi:MAG: sulfotransferase [Proteobacteria bacterium]|nr:sulfotransferase [Pseudomonadota bacterium]
MISSATADLELIRASQLLESDPAAAARAASEILALLPGHLEANLLLATACRNLGEAGTAVSVLEQVTATGTEVPAILLELGRAYVAAGRAAEALRALEKAVALDPGFADAWRELAAQRFLAGDTRGGDEAYDRYTRLWHQPQELTDAVKALADNRVDAAEQILHRRLQHSPHDVAALRLLTEVALQREDEIRAERYLRQCLALAPGFAAARHNLAQLLYYKQQIAEMMGHLERLLATQPQNINYLGLKAHGFRQLGRNEEALALVEELVAEHPSEEQVWILYGTVLREIGQQARAVEAFRRGIAVRAGSPGAYASLANLKTYRFEDRDLQAMQEQLALPGIRGLERVQLEFALGTAWEDRREFAKSFEHYVRGNSLQRATVYYDPGFVTERVQRTRALFDAKFFAERDGWGSERTDPIFIVGLPRSGSTLLEQMLACHSQVEGTRELADLPSLALELVADLETPTQAALFEKFAALSRTEVATLAERYLRSTSANRRLGKARFIDKLPGNWSILGFALLLFPRASIIDARRHPMASGFSCYKQLFARGQQFAYDLREIGLFSRDYATLMRHFDEILPGRVQRAHYEKVVQDPEGQLRQILAYCDLPFEGECLRFHENRRPVSTLSSEQVRQPLYTESLDHWRNYDQWLGPLRDALGESVGEYPD